MNGINLQPPATDIAQRIYDLHTLALWVCGGIFLVVFLPMFYALWRHRKAAGHQAAAFEDNRRLELAWTVLPVLVLVALAWPATRLILAMKNTAGSDLTIKVTGHQWRWEYEYLDDGPRFLSDLATPRQEIDGGRPQSAHYLLEVDRPLVIPTGRKIRLVVTSTDVIHSWWVPAFGVKQDAIPGFIKEAWFQVDEAGTYRGQCAELCGIGHAFMPIVVEAVPPDRFDAWRKGQLAGAAASQAASKAAAATELSLADLTSRGAQVYGANCVPCHQANGLGVPGAFPALDGSAIVNGPLAAHLNRVFNGKPGTPMPAFGSMLSDLEIAAVITFERNSWHNKVPPPDNLVQPAEVAALRKH